MSDFEHDSVQLSADESVDMVNHPPHYQPLPGVDFDCIELARRLTFNVGNAVKYIWRTDRKNGTEDIEKARWYIRDANLTSDGIWWDTRLSARERTKDLLKTVAEAHTKTDPDSSRGWFFYALWREDLHEALQALDDMLTN